ncbi:MAG: NUDIX domain-containing protein [Rhodonellum sp.]|nr:NUDIX domain-containing protein [Rhodonellum sp.]MDO9550993.1 NUDIX domain-containing protein [Rhodonellum sp.]
MGFAGGFVDPDEEPFLACLRELREETDLQFDNGDLIGVFGEKGRDPRGWTVSVAYFFKVDSAENLKAKAGSDSSELNWFSV